MMIVPELVRAAASRPGQLAATVIPSLLVSAAHVAQAIALSLALAAAARAQFSLAIACLAGVAAAALARGALALWQASAASRLGGRVRQEVRRAGLRGALRVETVRDPERRPGALSATLGDGVDGVDAYVSHYLPALITLAIATPAIVLGLGLVSWPAALVVAIGVALALLAPRAWSRFMQRRSQEQWESYEGLAAELSESLRGMATLRALGRIPWARARINARSERLRAQTEKAMRASLAETALTDLAIQGALAATAACAVLDALTPGTVPLHTYLILMLSGEAFRPVRELSKQWHAGYLGLGAVPGLKEVGAFDPEDSAASPHAPTAAPRATPEGVHPASGIMAARPPAGKGLRVSGVRFAYDGGRAVLDGASLRAGRGRLTAVVGESGAGKSTLFDLLLGFLEPGSGGITLDGEPLRPADVALVSQHPVLFEGSVRENLDPTGRGLGAAELERACREAGVWEEIQARGGLDSFVGEGGKDLSGGQLQRVAIARALLTRRPVLLLDEPTSALDTERAAGVLAAARRAAEDRVVVLITHREDELPAETAVFGLSEGTLALRSRAVRHGDHA